MGDAVRGGVNSAKFLNGTGGQYSALMAGERLQAEESRVPPLTDFTAGKNPLPLLAKNRDVPSNQLKTVVEAAGPMVKDGEEHVSKKP